jgi:hypothetical protein
MALFTRPQSYTRVGQNRDFSCDPWLTSLVTELLETVLFANIRFHDTVSRGRLLNRFGKDFEGLFT